MFENCFLATIAYENHEFLPFLTAQFPDLIIYLMKDSREIGILSLKILLLAERNTSG